MKLGRRNPSIKRQLEKKEGKGETINYTSSKNLADNQIQDIGEYKI